LKRVISARSIFGEPILGLIPAILRLSEQYPLQDRQIVTDPLEEEVNKNVVKTRLEDLSQFDDLEADIVQLLDSHGLKYISFPSYSLFRDMVGVLSFTRPED
jgi:hypothetical protein